MSNAKRKGKELEKSQINHPKSKQDKLILHIKDNDKVGRQTFLGWACHNKGATTEKALSPKAT